MSPGKTRPNNHVAYAEDLCRLDVLGLSDKLANDRSLVYAEFKGQLMRHPEGWYQTEQP